MFANSFTPSQAYSEFLKNLKNNCDNELNFPLQKADRSKCPRRRDFNSLYAEILSGTFRRWDGPKMLSNLEERTDDFLNTNKNVIPNLRQRYRICFHFSNYDTADDQSPSRGICCLHHLYICRYPLSTDR